MKHKSILVVSDNEFILKAFIKIIQDDPGLMIDRIFEFACHPDNRALSQKEIEDYVIRPLKLKDNEQAVIEQYDLVLSAHCKQLFPERLVQSRRCINIHPGYNPYNRGWYPQAFAIINGLPLGATIHEIDSELDHGAIIDQEKIAVYAWDTSLTAYNRVQQLEVRLLERSLPKILDDTYESHQPAEEGNLNLKKDFENLREINLDETVKFGEAINRLRALTHPPYKNAYFYDPKTGAKIWTRIELQKDEASEDSNE